MDVKTYYRVDLRLNVQWIIGDRYPTLDKAQNALEEEKQSQYYKCSYRIVEVTERVKHEEDLK